MVPAAAYWKAAVVDGAELPAITLLVVPYIALGESQHSASQRFFDRLWRNGQLPRQGVALFVRRDHACGDDGDSKAAAVASPAAPMDLAAAAVSRARCAAAVRPLRRLRGDARAACLRPNRARRGQALLLELQGEL